MNLKSVLKNFSFLISHFSSLISHFSSQKGFTRYNTAPGFTLVEVLIVIAVLGVLAATVVVAINPLEHIARAKDSEKKTNVANLFKGLQSGFILGGGTYPEAVSGWINNLVTAGELKNNPSGISTNVPCLPAAEETAGIENGYCYKVSDDKSKAVVYTALESNKELEGCTGTCDVAYYAISSETGTPQVLFGDTGIQPSTDGTVVPVFKKVFVTSTSYNGNLMEAANLLSGPLVATGLKGGDKICQNRAETAGRSGTWNAWLSDATQSPSTRFTRSLLVPYVLVDGTVIANNWDDLVDGTIDLPINKDEFNNAAPVIRVYTGTTPNGVSFPQICNGWITSSSGTSALVGRTNSATGAWTSESTLTCNFERPLFCFEQ